MRVVVDVLLLLVVVLVLVLVLVRVLVLMHARKHAQNCSCPCIPGSVDGRFRGVAPTLQLSDRTPDDIDDHRAGFCLWVDRSARLP